MHRSALALFLLCAAARVEAAPDPGAALHALIATPFRVTGDAVGASGLVGAAALGLCGDGLALIDHNRFTKPILFGVASTPVRWLALGVSQGSTGLLEGLRAEDVERLPEPRAAYLENAPGIGRIDTVLTAFGALRLAVEDAVTGPAVFALHAVGANTAGRRVSDFARDERIRALGPLVREAPPDSD